VDLGLRIKATQEPRSMRWNMGRVSPHGSQNAHFGAFSGPSDELTIDKKI